MITRTPSSEPEPALADWNGVTRGADGLPVTLSLFLPPQADLPPPLVVFFPGFKGSKDWGLWSWMARTLSRVGLAVATVNLSHCGVQDHGTEFTRLDLFEADTWGRRLEDAHAALRLLRDPTLPVASGLDPRRLGLCGHSMGGGLALLTAASDDGVRAVATLAGIAHVDRFSPAQKEELHRTGFTSFPNARTGQEMRVGLPLLLEIERGEIDVPAAARQLGRPLRIIQGQADPVVTLEEAHILEEAGGEDATLLLLPEADHTFGVRQPPMGAPPEPFTIVVRDLQRFFCEHLV